MFPNYTFKYYVNFIFDQCPLMLDTGFSVLSRGYEKSKPCFEACWLLEESCEEAMRCLCNGSMVCP